ncbi:MAG: hypothetical protein AB1705_14845 [Verrucomicrobiota bacterium]
MPLKAQRTERVVINFGQARLVAARDGRLELRGGSAEERTAVKEWVSLFMHEAVVSEG